MAKYPHESPYVSMGNNPIFNNDVLGDDYGVNVKKRIAGLQEVEKMQHILNLLVNL